MNLYIVTGPSVNVQRFNGSIKLGLPISASSENVAYNFWSHEFIFNETTLDTHGYQWHTNYDRVDKIELDSKCQNQTFLVEGLRQKELMIVVHGAHNKIVLRNNDIVHITVIDDGTNNTIDLTQQLLQRTSMETGPTTRICFPTMTAPLCFCCIDAVATKVFQPCGHYGVCTKCANNSQMKCPICRQRCHTASLFVVST